MAGRLPENGRLGVSILQTGQTPVGDGLWTAVPGMRLAWPSRPAALNPDIRVIGPSREVARTA